MTIIVRNYTVIGANMLTSLPLTRTASVWENLQIHSSPLKINVPDIFKKSSLLRDLKIWHRAMTQYMTPFMNKK